LKQYDYIAVDFDGTLNVHAFPEIGEPKPRIIEFIKHHAAKGTKIILHTCRDDIPGGPQYLTAAVEWCKAHGIPIHAVNENPFVDFGKSGKLYADIYIDDRAINVNSIKYTENGEFAITE
jgi:hypothetical protein